MVSSVLVADRIGIGRRIVERLDKARFVVSAAFWYYFPEEGRWRLFIASPVVDQQGPRAAYETIHKAQRRGLKAPMLSASEIVAVSPKDPTVRLLSSAMQTGPGLYGIHFSGNVINGVYVEDAYIYRLAKVV